MKIVVIESEAFDLRRMMASDNLQPGPSPQPQSSATPPASAAKAFPKVGAPAASSATAQV